jgi:hypothetical protein
MIKRVVKRLLITLLLLGATGAAILLKQPHFENPNG